MKNQALYSVIFEDGTCFLGGNDYYNTKWLEIPSKKIKRIFYRLPSGDYLTLDGHTKYYHMIETTKDLNGKRQGEVRPEYAYIMGLKDNTVISYKIPLCVNSNILIQRFNINDKLITDLNKKGWK